MDAKTRNDLYATGRAGIDEQDELKATTAALRLLGRQHKFKSAGERFGAMMQALDDDFPGLGLGVYAFDRNDPNKVVELYRSVDGGTATVTRAAAPKLGLALASCLLDLIVATDDQGPPAITVMTAAPAPAAPAPSIFD